MLHVLQRIFDVACLFKEATERVEVSKRTQTLDWVKGLTLDPVKGLSQSIVSLPRDAAAAASVCC